MHPILALSEFSASIYLGSVAILILVFIASRSHLLVAIVASIIMIIILMALDCAVHAEDVRDASGKLMTRSSTAGKTETVRDAGTGQIKEARTTTGNTTTVRDTSGKIIRTEKK